MNENENNWIVGNARKEGDRGDQLAKRRWRGKMEEDEGESRE